MARRRKVSSKYKENQNDSAKRINSSEAAGESSKMKEESSEMNASGSRSTKGNNSIPSAANDAEWYDRDPALTQAACSIPFGLPFGADLNLFKGINAAPGGVAISANIPDFASAGICSVLLKPSMGVNGGKSSPANVCANALYTHVRYMNSGRKNYDPVDLFMYVAAFGDIYSFVNWCIRIYNYAFMYSQRNWYIGRDLLVANGIDPDNIVANLANFRYWINSIINKISSFCVPGDVYYFKRRVFLFANYYVENPYGNIKDQLYQFVPDGFYAFDYDNGTPAKGKLKYNLWDSSVLHPWTDLQAFFELTLMVNITGDEDFGLMSGDIRKAYGDNIMMLTSIPEEGGILPVFDPYVLSQFKNAFTASVDRADSTKTFIDHNGDTHIFGDIEQSTDGLVISCEGYASWSSTIPRYMGSWAAAKHILSVENPNPGTGDVIEATRLMPHLGLIPASGGAYQYVFNCGTEIATNTRITYRPSKDNTSISQQSHGCLVSMTAANLNGTADLSDIVLRVQFKYAPTLYIAHIASSSGANILDYFMPVSNLDNTTTVTNENLMRIHEVALLSLFYVPGVAKLA